jgi:hypothetical protein
VFPVSFRGALDLANPGQVAGWALDRSDPDSPVYVQLYVDGRFAAETSANLARPDVVDAGLANEPNHGFAFVTPQLTAGNHEARVYAPHLSLGGKVISLQEIGLPLQFEVR